MCLSDWRHGTYVKSPVASLCLVCSSVRNLVRVMMSVLIASWGDESPFPLPAMLRMCVGGIDRRYRVVCGGVGRQKSDQMARVGRAEEGSVYVCEGLVGCFMSSAQLLAVTGRLGGDVDEAEARWEMDLCDWRPCGGLSPISMADCLPDMLCYARER